MPAIFGPHKPPSPAVLEWREKTRLRRQALHVVKLAALQEHGITKTLLTSSTTDTRTTRELTRAELYARYPHMVERFERRFKMAGEYRLRRARLALVDYMTSKVFAAKSPLLTILNVLPGGWITAFAILEHVAKRDSESDAAKLMAAWQEIHEAQPLRSKIIPEKIAEAAGMTPSRMLGIVVEAAHEMTVNTSKLVAALSMDSIMERAVKEARKPSGFKDRERILQSAGLYPAPSGVTINNSPMAIAQARADMATSIGALDGLDDFERDTMDSTSFLRNLDGQADPKSLESPAAFVQTIPAEVVESVEVEK